MTIRTCPIHTWSALDKVVRRLHLILILQNRGVEVEVLALIDLAPMAVVRQYYYKDEDTCVADRAEGHYVTGRPETCHHAQIPSKDGGYDASERIGSVEYPSGLVIKCP